MPYLSFINTQITALLVIPLGAALLLWALQKRLRRGAGVFTATALLLGGIYAGALLVFCLQNFPPVLPNGTEQASFHGILDTGGASVALNGESHRMAGLGYYIDFISNSLNLLVFGIAFLVALFSIPYMKGDRHYTCYFAYLCFFVFAMQGLVVSDHLIQLFVFWELVGVASYLLIGFWYSKAAAAAAAKKAFLVNRIGDACFLAAIGLLYRFQLPLELHQLTDLPAELLHIAHAHPVIGVFLLLGILGKSAQFPLQVWLPDAMQGPTPVSALIHAATMVVAGIYLLIRVSPLLTPILPLISWVGGITALLGALSALTQTDIKKVLAYSTISQLGFMVIGIGAGVPEASFFHLLTHAFFKAGLFLGAGAVIHYLHEQQHHGNLPKHLDVQHIGTLGGLHKHLPLVSIAFALCGAALAGLPLFSGFLSKEAILGGALEGPAPLTGYLGLAAAALTPIYIARIWKLTFWGEAHPDLLEASSGSNRLMAGIVLLLGLLSLALWFGPDMFHPDHSWVITSLPGALHHGPAWLMPVSIALSIGGVAWALLRKRPGRTSLSDTPLGLAAWSYHSFYLDDLYLRTIVPAMQRIGQATYWTDRRVVDGALHILSKGQVVWAYVVRFFDQYGIDGLVIGLARLARSLGYSLSNPRSGQVQTYLIRALAVALLLLAYLILG